MFLCCSIAACQKFKPSQFQLPFHPESIRIFLNEAAVLDAILEGTMDLYICYSNINIDEVMPAIQALEDAGLSCCMPGRDFEMDFDWLQKVTDSIAASVMVLYFQSDASRRSTRLFLEQKEVKQSGLMMLTFEVGSVTPKEVLEKVMASLPAAREIKDEVTKIVPYDGTKPYIFASYSHKDKEKVFKILRLIIRHGYRVWFDEGIDPGTEWAENIAAHLLGAGYMIAFFSENFYGSDNCNDELDFAKKNKLPILPIYLEDAELVPAVIAMKAGRYQALFFYQYNNPQEFLKQLDIAENISAFHNEEGSPTT